MATTSNDKLAQFKAILEKLKAQDGAKMNKAQFDWTTQILEQYNDIIIRAASLKAKSEYEGNEEKARKYGRELGIYRQIKAEIERVRSEFLAHGCKVMDKIVKGY